MEGYTGQLKKRYKSQYVPENQWPLFAPKFTKLGFIIHKCKHNIIRKCKRTAQEAKKHAKSARSETLSSKETIHMSDTFNLKNDDDDKFDAVDEEISNIFLPISSDIKDPQLQIILIEGAPGIGKTMLIMEIGRLWANEKILNDKKMLLFFSLSDPAIKDMKSTEDMFFSSFKNESNARICAEYFGSISGRGLVVLLDGLDENPQTMQKGSFFYDLIIVQRIFIETCFVITSRPHATTKLQPYVNCRVEIIGFTDKRRSEFVQENLEKNAESLKSYLQKHEIIDTLCYIPLNMCIVVSFFNTEIELENLPSTQTELTMQAVSITVFHNLEKLEGIKKESKIDLKHLPKPYDEIFYYLSALAYKALTENKTIEEIRKAYPVPTNSDDDKIERAITNGLGLIQTTRFFTGIGGNTESSSNFAHYSVQELLAAWYIAFNHHSCFLKLPLTCNVQKGIQNCMKTLFQWKVLSTNFWDGKFINMWSFYIGLTGGKDFAFKWILSENVFNRSIQCKKLYFLQKTTSSETVEHVEYNLSKKVLKNKIKTLLLYFLLQEAPGNEIIKHLDTVVTQEMLDVSEQTLQSKEEDIHLLGSILSTPYLTKQWELVNISYCEIDDEMFKILYKVLTRNDGRPKPEIKALSLSGNKLTSCSDAIVHLVCCQKIQHLNLSNNNLQSMMPFRRCGDFLETLHISNNKLDNEKALELFNALKFLGKLKVLHVDHNNINDDQRVVDAIGLALCYCNSLKELKLDGNTSEFEDKAMILFEVIDEIRESKSNVHYYRLTDKSSAFLKILGYCDKIDYQADSCVLKKKIMQSKVVNVSCNGLKTDDGCFLGQNLYLLAKMKILNITKNKISDEGTKTLTIGMLLTSNLEEFKYDEDLFSEDSNMIFRMIQQLRNNFSKNSFKCAPSKVKALVFILNCINDNKEKVQSSDIVSTIGFITELNLSHNKPTAVKLANEELKDLCALLKWFRQLKVLDVRNNDITDEAKEPMAKAMLQIHTLNCLKLFGNPISDDEVSMAMFDTIKNVREEQLKSIIYNQNKSSCIEFKAVIKIMECLSQLENPNCFKSLDNIITVDIVSEPGYGIKFLLSFLPFLRNLKINNVTSISECGINQLSNYLSQNRTLITLDLSFCNLCNLAVKNGPSNIFPLQILKINYSNITDEVLFMLSFHMLKFTNLKHLELEGNCFGDKGISNLRNVLLTCQNTSATITELNLANNQLTSSSTAEIIEIVQICKVKCLNISNNNLQSIFSHFEKYIITTLEELNVSANNHQTCNAVHFAESISYLKSCRSLKKLDISNNNIDDTAIDAICCSFMECSHLKDVPCNKNQAEKKIESAFHFVQSLNSQHNCIIFKELPALAPTLISVISCSLSDQTGGFSKVSQVTEIDFSCNNLKIDKNLVCVLQNCTQLTVLNLECNNITNETFKYLATGFLFTSKLKYPKLHLKGNPCMDNPKNDLVLQMIATLRSDVIDFECPPQNFESFIVVLELVDSVSGSPNDVSKTISLIKSLNLSLKTLNLSRKSLSLSHSELSSSFNKQARDTNQVLLQSHKSLNLSHSELSSSFNKQARNANQVLLQSCDVKLLCHYFKYFNSLKSINMMNNNIKEDIKDDLAIAVLQHYCLTEIQLEGNPICKQKKCFRLFDTIEKLRRSGNSYTFKDRPEMLEALVTILKYINNFDDKFCDITDSCECLDVSSFYQQKTNNRLFGIEKIDNPGEICTSLVYHLKLFCRLKILNLSNAHLTTLDALQELSRFLHNNNTLLQLNLSNNRIQVEGALLVLQSLDTNTTLTKLNLNNNKLSGTKCKEIARKICRLKSINVDILRGNELTPESKEMIKMIQ